MFKIQLKNMSRDRVIIISIFLPIVLALILKFFTPSSLIVEPKVGVIDNNLSESMITELKLYAEVKTFYSMDELENRVNVTSDELVGIVYDKIGKEYTVILQGNETNRTREIASQLANINNDSANALKYSVEVLPLMSDSIKEIIAAIVVIIAFYMGSTLITFSLVTEKEEGLTNIFSITPITKTKIITQKILLGFLITLIVSIITSFIILDINHFFVSGLFIAISSLSAVSLGLFLGHYSKDLISAIINTKVVLLVFIFIPFIAMLMPDKLNTVKNLFFILPSYPMFRGLLSLYSNGSIQEILFYIFIIAIHVIVCYYVYMNKVMKNLH